MPLHQSKIKLHPFLLAVNAWLNSNSKFFCLSSVVYPTLFFFILNCKYYRKSIAMVYKIVTIPFLWFTLKYAQIKTILNVRPGCEGQFISLNSRYLYQTDLYLSHFPKHLFLSAEKLTMWKHESFELFCQLNVSLKMRIVPWKCPFLPQMEKGLTSPNIYIVSDESSSVCPMPDVKASETEETHSVIHL